MLRNMSNDNPEILIGNEIYRNNYIINCKSCEEGTRHSIISNDRDQPHNRD